MLSVPNDMHDAMLVLTVVLVNKMVITSRTGPGYEPVVD